MSGARGTAMHRYTEEMDAWAAAIVDYALDRIRTDPPLDGFATMEELRERAGGTITDDGIGGLAAFKVFSEELSSATISTDHPLFTAFVPGAPTNASVLFDILVGASSIVGSSWTEGAGAIFAENEALAWLAQLAGMPSEAGGTFVSGGSAANLAGLVAARHTAATRRIDRPARWRMAVADEAHSSVYMTARIMDVDVLPVPSDDRGRLTGDALVRAIEGAGSEAEDVFAVVATAGTTNGGFVDDLAPIADLCEDRGYWFHVDAAYGGAALAAPSVREHFTGIERADSLAIDPHKWLFAPFDCAAVLYRDPALAAAAHTQEAEYLNDLNEVDEWTPPHYAYHLTRRVRGLPFWYSLATHGTKAYTDAVEQVLQLTRDVAADIAGRPGFELLVEPELSIVLFERTRWSDADYLAWCDRVLAEGRAFCQPTVWRGTRCMRLCFVNPTTTPAMVSDLLDTMAG